MPKVKILLEIEVEEDCKFVTIDEDGEIGQYTEEPGVSEHGAYWGCYNDYRHCLGDAARVVNWRETCTEVK